MEARGPVRTRWRGPEAVSDLRSLVDTNVLVYRIDPRDPPKREVATDLLRRGFAKRSIALPHQAILEFVATSTRFRSGGPDAGRPLLPRDEALRQAEELMWLAPVLYPNSQVVRTALRGVAVYGLSWFDAHLWAYAEVFGIPEILSEDFEHGRRYGTVRVVDPFHELAEGEVHEPRESYG